MERSEPRDYGLVGREVVDMDGTSVGNIEQVIGSDGSLNSGWAAVSTGLVEKKLLAVPLVDATIDEKVTVPYPKDLISNAPELNGGELRDNEEMNAYRHYNLRRELKDDFQPAELADPPVRPGVPHESIAARAYEIYEDRGRDHGRHKEDWLTAEKELADRTVQRGTEAPITPEVVIE